MRSFLFLSLLLVAQFAVRPSGILGTQIAKSAFKQIGVTTSYDPSYRALAYPGGDVSKETGVCTDVVVRSLRAIGIDLQKEVHEDMTRNFSRYPQHWGLKRPDKNIDHRRVPNLMTYLKRHHQSFSKFHDSNTFQTGDIVAWKLTGGRLHIGIVSERRADGIPWIVHNIGQGTKEENLLHQFDIIGHYRIQTKTK